MSSDTNGLQQLLETRYGLIGELERLLGERDRNYRLKADSGQSYVVKIVDADESELTSDFQIQALRHLERKECAVAVPRVVNTTGGDFAASIDVGGERRIVRVVTWVPGSPMSDVELDEHLARELGVALASVDKELADFRHTAERRDLAWDMQNAGRLRQRTAHIADRRIRQKVAACFDVFVDEIEPRFSSIRHQVIHSDLNPANVLVTSGPRLSIAGIIDFSDMVRAPLVVDVAIAASYLRSATEDALELIAPFVAGFNSVVALEEAELNLLYDLVQTRLATTITMKFWRAATAGKDDPYLAQTMDSERDAEDFLIRLGDLSRSAFAGRIRASISDL